MILKMFNAIYRILNFISTQIIYYVEIYMLFQALSVPLGTLA